MRKFFLVTLILMLHALLFADIACDSSDTCPDGMYCSPDDICAMDPNGKASYAEISVALGENSPGAHSDALYVSASEETRVLGQFTLSLKNPGETQRIYTSFNSLSVKQQRSSAKIALKNVELVYDKNGNGKVDTDDEVWSSEVIEESMLLTFTIDDYHIPLKINNDYSLLIVGAVTYDDAVIPDNQMLTLRLDDESMIDITAKDAVAIVAPNVSFPKIIVIPSGNVLLFTVGEHLPEAPAWDAMTGFLPVLHIAVTAVEQDVEWSGFRIKVSGSSQQFGTYMPAVKVSEDKNNDGIGESVLATISVEHDGSSFVEFKPSGAPALLKKGEYSYFVVEVDMQLVRGQYAEFVVDSMNTEVKVVGSAIVSDTFKYDCTKEDDGCRLPPDEMPEASSGCSVLTVF